MAALWASLPLPQSQGANMHPSLPLLPPQAAARANNSTRSSAFACPMLIKTQQMPSGQRH